MGDACAAIANARTTTRVTTILCAFISSPRCTRRERPTGVNQSLRRRIPTAHLFAHLSRCGSYKVMRTCGGGIALRLVPILMAELGKNLTEIDVNHPAGQSAWAPIR